ncbi:PQQ-dependent sugar dehydrogenase [Candidatus Gracilibacteria bacterium]|nr:PQQ-dependent sugar dehydrogenase [Candidatus Gracilibacteria bacterium]
MIRLVLRRDQVIAEEWLLEELSERFRDVHNGRDGNLYFTTDSGKIYRVTSD